MKRCDQGAILTVIDDPKAIQLSEFFKMFSDPNRIRLLSLLCENEVCVQHLSEALDMSPSAVSHQLRLLRQQRVVKFVQHGKKKYYSLDDEHVVQILNTGIIHLNHKEK